MLNEHECLKKAKEFGLHVSDAFLLPTERPVLCVERYDRRMSESVAPISGLPAPVRLHQEDMCQAFGIPSHEKYDEHLWGGIGGIGAFLRAHSASPGEDIAQLVDIMVFNYRIGNCDNHLKNLSLLYSRDWSAFSLAPCYDIVSTLAYANLDTAMGMKIGRHRNIDEVIDDDFALLADTLHVSHRLVTSSLERSLPFAVGNLS